MKERTVEKLDNLIFSLSNHIECALERGDSVVCDAEIAKMTSALAELVAARALA